VSSYAPITFTDGSTPLNKVTMDTLQNAIIDLYAKQGQRFQNSGNPLVDIVNTAALTDVFAQAIPAGAMGTKGRIRGRIAGDWKDNVGSNQGVRLQVLFGGAIIHDSTHGSLGANSANRQLWLVDFELGNSGVANAQFLSGRWHSIDTSQPLPPAGIGGFLDVSNLFPFGGYGTVDTTLAQTLNVKLAPSAANANLSWRVFRWELEVISAT
jgi:hypothetical protein